MKIVDIIQKIEDVAPVSLAEPWDNTGWQIKLESEETQKVMIALSPTIDVFEQAKKQGCGLVITHHPLFFNSKINQINPSNLQNKIMIFAIQNNIQLYAAHTNLDKADGGINDKLAELFGLYDVTSPDGLVRVGMVDEISVQEFALRCKKALGCDKVKLINPVDLKTIKTVGICGGAGFDLINTVDIDIFVTGDVKYHNALDVLDKAVLDVGHFESEKIILPYLEKILAPCDTFLADEKNPWELL